MSTRDRRAAARAQAAAAEEHVAPEEEGSTGPVPPVPDRRGRRRQAGDEVPTGVDAVLAGFQRIMTDVTRVIHPAVPPAAPVAPTVSLERFIKHNPLTFSGDPPTFSGEEEQAYDFLDNIREICLELSCTDTMYARREDLLDKIHGNRTKQPTRLCKIWIRNVNKIEKEVQILEAKYGDEKRCRSSIFHFLQRSLQRSELSKSMVEKHDELQSFSAAFPTEIVVERSPRLLLKNETPKINNKPSLHRIFERILQSLSDVNVKRIGLWGMMGVGKTSIMQNLNEDEQIARMFDQVIFVSVTEEGTEEQMQYEIAQQLGLNLEDSTDTKTIASRISRELECNRYLLLLDDVWGNFDLDRIGVCDNGKDSKVVFASRNSGICRYMLADDIIPVERLPDDDALKLFQESLGRNINSAFKPVVQKIIRECANLPILIDKVARTFREKGENILLWEAALNKLIIYPDVGDKSMDEVHKLLAYCYDGLNDEDKKVCFLYSALHPEGSHIYEDYLLECWQAQGFTENVGSFTAHDRGLEILHHLINVSLLESSKEMKFVWMNKIIRKMALKISMESGDSKCLVEAGKKLQVPPDEVEWKQKNWISLMDNMLRILPERPICENLSTLLLQRNYNLTVLPQLFFQSMPRLRVLDLHSTGITTLPSSMSCLTGLRALYLNSCKNLLELPSCIKVLKDLEVLDIRGSGINFLPVEIGHLLSLRCFRMSLSKIEEPREGVIYPNVISKLLLLEELIIDVDPENQWWNKVVKVIAADVAALTKLTYLSCSIGQYHSTMYKRCDYLEYKNCRCLKYADGQGKVFAVPEQLVAKTNAFELIGHRGVVALSDFGIHNFNHMKSCLIESCNEMITVINGNQISEPALESLEKMCIRNVPKLKWICEGPIPIGSLTQLTTLILFRCSNLKKIFSGDPIWQLSKLQHLEVKSCNEIEEIITECENDGLASHALPQLETLILVDLPRLESICIGAAVPTLQKLVLTDLPSLKSICSGTLPTLKRKINRCPKYESYPCKKLRLN